MKFFKVNEPYYALIKANDKEAAIKLYEANVAENIDGEVNEDIRETSANKALVIFSRATSEDGKIIPINEILTDFESEEEMILLIEGTLL
jgi:hypothetical protein